MLLDFNSKFMTTMRTLEIHRIPIERNLKEHHQAIQSVELCEGGDVNPIGDYHGLKILGDCIVYDIHLSSVEVVYDGLGDGFQLNDSGFPHDDVLTSAWHLHWYSVGWEAIYE